MNRKRLIIGLIVISSIAVAVLALFLSHYNVAVLNPKGTIADKQRDLIIITTLLMLIVVIPVFVMTAVFSWRYREGNKKKSKYRPDWDHSHVAEFVWWTVPLIIISIIGVIIWRSSHDLDPYKPLESSKQPIKVQVVALQWKWLFIYPEQGIATVNYVQFPEDTPVNFEITADAPMNSFWIPQLGGQVYAMSGMTTKLHLMANEQGSYDGMSANLSGEGFADMKFTAKATSQTDFDQWLRNVKNNSTNLSEDKYKELAQPSKNNVVTYFADSDDNLYNKILMKYMMPKHQTENTDQQKSEHEMKNHY